MKINEKDLSYIINCEESSIIFKTKRKEKTRITALLTICSNGKKLMPYIIFKGKKG